MDMQENKTEKKQFFQMQYISENPKTDMGFRLSLAFLCILFIIAYVICFAWEFDFAGWVSNKKDDWGTFGDYIGGTVGTVIAFFVFLATLRIIKLQKKTIDLQENELKDTRKIFNQEQFEQTFFNLIKLIGENQVKENSDNGQLDYHIIYGLVKEIKKNIENYRNKLENDLTNEKDEEKKHKNKEDIKEQIDSYINILKLQIKDETHLELLDKIMGDKDEELRNYYKETHFCEFMDIGAIRENIEKYTKYFGKEIFGENQELQERVSKQTNLTAKDYEELYKPDGNNVTTNIAVLKNLAQNTGFLMPKYILEELAEYKGDEEKEIHLNIVNNPNVTEKALEILSKNKEKEIRKLVANHKNTSQHILEQLVNDNEKEVSITALGNSNISQQTIKSELEKNYNKLNISNIKEIIYIIFNNSKVYDIDKMFNQYITSVIEFMQKQSDKREYEIREIFLYYMREIEYKHITKKIFIKSIENILDNKYQTFCYYILLFYRALCHNNIMTYHDNIYSIIYDKQKMVSDLSTEKKLKECKEKISSIFKEHETELREFIEQLKND